MVDVQPESPNTREINTKQVASLVLAVALIAGLIAFVVQNSESTPIKWLWWNTSAPLWVVIVISVVAGSLLLEITGWLIRRRRKDR